MDKVYSKEEVRAFLDSISDIELIEVIVRFAHCDNQKQIPFTSKLLGTTCGIDNDGYNLARVIREERKKKFFEELGTRITNEGLLAKVHELNWAVDKPTFPIVGLDYSNLGKDIPGKLRVDIPKPRKTNYAGFSYQRQLPRNFDELFEGIIKTANEGGSKTFVDRALRNEPIFFTAPVDGPTPTYGPSPYHLRVMERRNEQPQGEASKRFQQFIKDIPVHELFEVGDLIVNNMNCLTGLGGYYSRALEQTETVYLTDLPLVYDEIKTRFKNAQSTGG